MRKNKLDEKVIQSLQTFDRIKEKSFDEALEDFCEDRRRSGTRESTIVYYQKELSLFRRFMVREKEGVIKVSEIDKELLDGFVNYLRDERGNNIGGVNAKIRAVRAFMFYCAEMKYILNNPAENWKQIKGKEPEINAFTSSQIKALLKQADRQTFTGLRDYNLMLFLLDTGARISEALSVKVDDVLMAEGRVFLRNTKSNLNRYVPISDRLKNELKQYIRVHDGMSEYLFCSLDGQLLNRNRFRYILHTYGKEAEIKNVRCSPHTFRHTFAKFYILNGGDAFSLMQIMGHSTLDMTKKYVRLFSTDVVNKHKQYSPINNL
ncbi:hypothetical protein CHH61_18855 [Shouchella clausii]|uniref:Integrase n=1 Tax=Shouchella clausii TaxID=79880 RepID=A0A268RVR7_SHOCL|nr:tyrosine-type recombinase/integrase [Shouchella clausii]PAF24358.1 hypothetical protein CHH61_18855 [Shouchella clausii]